MAPNGQGRGGAASGWQTMALADFTGDQRADILWRNQRTHQVALWQLDGMSVKLGPDSQTRVVNQDLPSSFRLSGVGDLDGDGIQDVVLRDADRGVTKFWRFTPTGQSILTEDRAIATNAAWQIAAVQDINQDGSADLIWRDLFTGQIGICLMRLSGRVNLSLNDNRLYRK